MGRADRPGGAHVTYQQQYRRCGKAGCSRCAAGGRGHGPYWYAFWWAEGRQHSRYLGKQAPAEAGVGDVHVSSGASAHTSTARAPSAATVEPLRVRTLGDFVVWRGETPIPRDAWSSRVAALFNCLLSVPGHRLTRDQAMELLWPEADPVAAAHRLRTTIHRLRRLLAGPHAGASYLSTQAGTLALTPAGDAPPDAEWLDATAFANAARAALAGHDIAACRATLARYTGDFLPDEPYADWAAAPREALRQQHLDLLLHLATLAAGQGHLEEAEGCLRRVLAVEPGHEAAVSTLMGLLAESGRRVEALRIYQALATALEEDLGVTPGAEVTALRARLLAPEAARMAAQVSTHAARPARRTNLPVALTSFVGRAWDVAEVTDALSAFRLVTLTGPGGCGKTRLALAVADALVEAYPDGVWLVELAARAEPAAVPQAMRLALGIAEQPGQSTLDTLIAFLRSRDLLLVMDNCEHLIGACAELAAALLQSCSQLRLLATSREALSLAGERTYLVPSLTAPDPDHVPPLERLEGYEAVQLFLERARLRRPAVTLTAATAPAVAQICARLDGLPLAIELAAARVSSLPVETIAARLDDRFLLLTRGPRTALPRQQTLRATLDWSYALLSRQERMLLRRLAIFAGGWTLAAAEAICAGPELAAEAVLDLLANLVHKSLVLLEAPTDGSSADDGHYRLLETVRQYGLEKLAAAGESGALRDRHLEWYVALGEQAAPHFEGPLQLAWLDRLEREHDNLRAALQRSTEQSSRDGACVALVAAIWPFWVLRGHPHEGRRRLEEALGRAGSAPPALRARLLNGAAQLAYLQGDGATANAYAEASLATYREMGDTEGVARVLVQLGWQENDMARAQALGEESLALAREAGAPMATATALHLLGNVAIGQHDPARAQTYLEEGAQLCRDRGDRMALARTLHDVGQVALMRAAYAQAAVIYEECLSLQRELGHPFGVASVLHLLGETAYYLGDTTRAVAALEESVALCRNLGYMEHLAQALAAFGRLIWQQGDHAGATALLEEGLSAARAAGDSYHEAAMLTTLGHIALARGDATRAATLHRESLTIHRGTGSPLNSLDSLEGLAITLGAQGQTAEGAWLLGAADAAREHADLPLRPPDREYYERSVAALRLAIGEDAFAAEWSAGCGTPLETAIAQALRGEAETQSL